MRVIQFSGGVLTSMAIACSGADDVPSPGGAAGSSTNGGSQSGSAGKDTGGAEAMGGTGANGGSSGGGTGTMLGASCSTPGRLACNGNHQKLKLLCSADQVWEANGTCDAGQFCQTATGVDLGTCLAEAPECEDEAPGALVCKGDELRECGVDAVDSKLAEACAYGCADGECRNEALCETGRADCDADPDCETDTTSSAKHCGACGNSCVGKPHASGYCEDSACSCESGYSDCTDAPGCETVSDTDPMNCGACGNVCAAGECAAGDCTSRVFMSSKFYRGDLGGLAGADAKCQALATAAKLAGTYRAWLSDATTQVDTRLPHSAAPYRSTDGTLIADNWQGLSNLENPIVADETGTLPAQSFDRVWTGYSADSDEENYCGDWTSSDSAVNGFATQRGFSGSGWQIGEIIPCGFEARLFCFEVNE